MMGLKVVWASLMAASFSYLAIGTWLTPTEAEQVPFVLYSLAGVAGLSGIASLVVPAWMLRSALLRLDLTQADSTPAKDNGAGAAPTGPWPEIPSPVWARALPAYVGPAVVGMALPESIAILGMANMIMGGRWDDSLGFFVVAWTLLLVNIPTAGRLRRALVRAIDARLRA
jgi:hypothetical protein